MDSEIKLKCVIAGHAILGYTPLCHALYRLEIEITSQNVLRGKPSTGRYALYRRFQDFEKLYHSVVQTYGIQRVVEDYCITPDLVQKESFGSFASSFQSVIARRMVSLQQLVDRLLTIEGIETNAFYASFFDTKNRGCSGARKQLGDKQIVKEILVRVKPGNTYFEFSWESSFVVLTTKGRLYILRSLYDDLSNPVQEKSLANGSVHLTERPDNVIEILCRATGLKTLLRFTTREEYVSWFRALADASAIIDQSEVGFNASRAARPSIAERMTKMMGNDQHKSSSTHTSDPTPVSSPDDNDDLNTYGI